MNIGVAQIDITPDFEVELSGFASREHPCVGVDVPIFARAIYLEDGGEKLLWIACDVLAFDPPTVRRIRERAKNDLNLQPRQVLLSATHTHSAPAIVELFSAGTYNARYVRFLEDKILDVARDASSATQPCEVVATRQRCDLAIDRRGKASAHTDPWASAIGFRKADNTFIAACVNYAMHPVAHGHIQRKISPDWCGATCDSLHQQLPGHPIVLASNGAAGNLNPPQLDLSWNDVSHLGEQIANAIAQPLMTATPQPSSLRVVSRTVELPLDWLDESQLKSQADESIARIPPDWQWTNLFKDVIESWRNKMLAVVRAGQGRSVNIELQAARIGDVHILAINGELFSKFTETLREKTRKELFVVGFANEAFGYIPARDAYAEGGYEVDQAHLFYGSFRAAPGGLELLCEKAAELLGGL